MPEEDLPNILVIFTDDQGYGDLGCFGAPDIRTPNIDDVARNGMKLTHFYVGSPVCTPSRAALMTGCYPRRVSLDDGVLFPGDEVGLHPDEETIATMLSNAGYATACIGKWHLGDRSPFLPTDHGFDQYFGIPYSNDMRPDNLHGVDRHPPLKVMRDDEVVERGPDQRELTRRYTEEAVSFIEDNTENPFFCYLPHNMPHVPLYASDQFEDRSTRGLYGDVIEEIDWSVGMLIDTLERTGQLEDTLVIFTSDNGPWLAMDEAGGHAGPLRGGKRTGWEGGVRVPTVAQWPGTIPEGSVCRELMTAMDLLPTFAAIAGTHRTATHPIDGVDCSSLLTDPESESSPRDHFLYHDANGNLTGIRDTKGWKLHTGDGNAAEERSLYNLRADTSETRNLIDEAPTHAERLQEPLETLDQALESGIRPKGTLE